MPILSVRSPKFFLENSVAYSDDAYPGRSGKSLEEIFVRVEIVKSGAVFPESLSADVGLFNPRRARLKPPLDHMFPRLSAVEQMGALQIPDQKLNGVWEKERKEKKKQRGL